MYFIFCDVKLKHVNTLSKGSTFCGLAATLNCCWKLCKDNFFFTTQYRDESDLNYITHNSLVSSVTYLLELLVASCWVFSSACLYINDAFMFLYCSSISWNRLAKIKKYIYFKNRWVQLVSKFKYVAIFVIRDWA